MYGVAEVLFMSVLSWLFMPGWVLMSWHWRLTAYLLLAYAGIGTLTGVVIGLIFALSGAKRPFQAASEETRFNALAALSVILVFAVVQAFEPNKDEYTWFLLGSCALFGSLIAAGAAFSRKLPWIATIASPGISMIAFVGFSWLAKNIPGEHPRPVRLASAALFLAGMLVTARFFPRMRMRPMTALGLPLLAVAACITLAVASGQENPGAGSGKVSGGGRPNIILIVLDTVRADHLPLYAYQRDTTPHLQQFAAEATTFTNATSTSNMSLASHASYFTGVYPTEHGAHFDPPAHPYGKPLDEKFATLAEILGAHGYATFGVVSNYANVSRGLGLGRGFNAFDDAAPIPLLDWRRRPFLRNAVRRALMCCFSTGEFETEYRGAEDITNLGLKDLESASRQGRPLFLFLNYMDAHWPLIPPAPFDTLFPGKDDRITTERQYDLQADVLALRRGVSDREKQHLISQYDGGIAYMDREVARLLGRLKQMGSYDNSLIIITSDHGEALGERELLGHLAEVYQDEVHVPLLIKFPHTTERKSVSTLVSGVDLMPTALNAAGIAPPDGLRGRDLRNLQTNQTRTVISETFPSQWYLDLHPTRFHRVERAIFSGEDKLISSTAGKRELYDLHRDPNEVHNLCGERMEDCRSLESSLESWLRAAQLRLSTSHPSTPERGLSKDAVERLKSLGYIQ
jgi:arylsulfatase A-like enzyme